MGHRRMTLLVAAVVCFGAVAWASEPPVGPWQSLNPSLEEETNPYVPAENTYPEEYNVEQTYYEDEAVEEDIPPLPFKLPFKVDKKQVVVAMKLLKEAVKPILKSKTLRDSLAYFDDAISGFNDDIETQLYVRLILDSLQDIYEGKEAGQIDMILKEFFTEFTGVSDEATARTIEDVWGEYVSPAMKNFVYTPVRKVFGSMMDRVYYPLYAVFNTIAERIDNYFDTDSNSSYLKVDYPDSDRWYETVNYISNRLGYISKSVRNSVEDARMLLEGKACNGCNPAEASQLSVE